MRPLLCALAMVSVSACAGGYHTTAVREDRLQHQLDIALRTRAQLVYYFAERGAVMRPPMPELLAEDSGAAPSPTALWTPGRWVWRDAQWTWEAGEWGTADVFTVGDVAFGGDLGDEGYADGDDISNPPPLVGVGFTAGVRDHRTPPHDWGSRLRDHRTHDGTTRLPAWASPSHPDANVRDHRTGGSSSGSSDSKSSDSKSKDKDSDKTEFGSGGHFHR